jgi:hypothetical protein
MHLNEFKINQLKSASGFSNSTLTVKNPGTLTDRDQSLENQLAKEAAGSLHGPGAEHFAAPSPQNFAEMSESIVNPS